MLPRLHLLLATGLWLYLAAAQDCRDELGQPSQCQGEQIQREEEYHNLYKEKEQVRAEPIKEKKARVCIIGAGPAGIISAKHALAKDFEVVVFEQKATVGGVWQYTAAKDPYAGMYEGMKTNSPKQIMMFNGYPFPEEDKSFMTPTPVLNYLKNFTETLKIPVRFKKTVISVDRSDGKWQVVVKDANGRKLVEKFDAVFVCNGHFFAPKKLMDHSKFEGTVIHSQDYRKADDYAGKRVAVIGAGPSGIDIAQLVAEKAKQVLLIGSTANYKGIRWNVKQVKLRVIEVGSNWLGMSDNTRLENLDHLIFCVGFEYKFPFLSKEIVQVSPSGQIVSPLYEHMLHRDYPDSLFFIGIPSGVSHFVLNEAQAEYAVRILNKEAPLPSKPDLKAWESVRKSEINRDAEFHEIGPFQWPYMERLAKLGLIKYWSYYKLMEKMYHYTVWSRDRRIADYKLIEFHPDWDKLTFTVTLPANKKKLRIGIVGAGPGGLITARLALNDGHEVVTYEQRATCGGVWHYTDDKDPYAGMYKGMKTNSPKEIMYFQGYPFKDELPSFMEPQPVLEYLQDFGENIPISYNHTVISVERAADKWQVIAIADKKRKVDYFDAIFISNGHFFDKKYPPFDSSLFKGIGGVIHSQDYRDAEKYANMKVAIVGAGPSGIDLAMLLVEKAQKVYLIGSNAGYNGVGSVVQVKDRVAGVDADSVKLEKGNPLEVDAIILCTGFNQKLPFLSDEYVQIVKGSMVKPTYQHVLHRDYPDSLFFIGLNNLISHFVLNEQQARYALEIATKRATLPSTGEMIEWETKTFEEKKFKEADFHTLGAGQWPYMEKLAALGNFPNWPIYKTMEKMFNYTIKMRGERLQDYKMINFTMVDNADGFVAILPSRH